MTMKKFENVKKIIYKSEDPDSYRKLVHRIPSDTEVILINGIGENGRKSPITMVYLSRRKVKKKFLLPVCELTRKEWLNLQIHDKGFLGIELCCGKFREDTSFISLHIAA